MANPALLIATAKIRPGTEGAFSDWQARYHTALGQVPGFIGTDLIPPDKPEAPWTLIVRFESDETLQAWQQTDKRAELLAEVVPLLVTGSVTEKITLSADHIPTSTEVTEVIFSKVRAGMGNRYREWSGRIQAAQASYAGYRGTYLQPPSSGNDGHWTTILRYDSPESLERWMNAPERRALLEESREFIESEELMHLATAFPGWIPVDPTTGEAPPNWKAAMLVLLGLFPIVMLEMKYLGPIFGKLSLNSSLATFIGNSISVALTSFWTMPLFVRWFEWWLFPKGDLTRVNTRGIALISLLFVVEVLLLWRLIP